MIIILTEIFLATYIGSFFYHTFLEFEISLETDLSSLCSGLPYAWIWIATIFL